MRPTPTRNIGLLPSRRDMARGAGALSVLGTASLLVGCGAPVQARNFEVEVEYLAFGHRLMTSVVRELRYQAYVDAMPSKLRHQWSVRGEGAGVLIPGTPAAIVMGNFALVTPDYGTGPFGGKTLSYFWNPATPIGRVLLPDSAATSNQLVGHIAAARTPSQWCPMTAEDLPILVMFADINEPASVQWIDPNDQTGPIRVTSARIRLTTDRRTKGKLSRILPWRAQAVEENWSALERTGRLTRTAKDISAASIL